VVFILSWPVGFERDLRKELDFVSPPRRSFYSWCGSGVRPLRDWVVPWG